MITHRTPSRPHSSNQRSTTHLDRISTLLRCHSTPVSYPRVSQAHDPSRCFWSSGFHRRCWTLPAAEKGRREYLPVAPRAREKENSDCSCSSRGSLWSGPQSPARFLPQVTTLSRQRMQDNVGLKAVFIQLRQSLCL